MKHSFTSELTANIEISDSDLKLLLEISSNHYDDAVKAMSRIGGFLYGFKNRRDFSAGEDKTVELTGRKIGLILKSLELNNSDQTNGIAKTLYAILNEMQRKTIYINKRMENF